MAIDYGFFNSVSGDRVYNADDVNDFLEGLISSSGIFANVGGMFEVTANTGLTLNVGTGKAMIQNHWVKSNAIETITLSTAHALLNRIDAIVLRLDNTNRQIILTTIEGSPASNPVSPEIVRDGQIYDICLAHVSVRAGTTAITQSAIKDKRLNSELCGFIVGLVEQLDTSQFMAQLEIWEQEQEQAFNDWFDSLTQELNVNTYVQQFTKQLTGTVAEIKDIELDMQGYSYAQSDIFMVSVNGLTTTNYIVEEVPDPENLSQISYVIIHLDMNADPSNLATNEVYVRVLKSKIGQA